MKRATGVLCIIALILLEKHELKSLGTIGYLGVSYCSHLFLK